MSASGNFPPHATYLLLDAAGVTPRLGLWQDGRWLAWRECTTTTMPGLFEEIPTLLAEAKLTWEKIDGFIYPEGPGSVLGLRLAAMAIRTWQVDEAARPSPRELTVWACGSLHLAAALVIAGGVPIPFTAFTEVRQGLWRVLEVNSGDAAALAAIPSREVLDGDLPFGALFHVPARKAWQGLPPQAQPLPTTLHKHPEIFQQPGLLRQVETATPYAGTPPEYRKWAGAEK